MQCTPTVPCEGPVVRPLIHPLHLTAVSRMEYCSKGTVRDYISSPKAKKVGVEYICRWMRQTASALAHVHAAGPCPRHSSLTSSTLMPHTPNPHQTTDTQKATT